MNVPRAGKAGALLLTVIGIVVLQMAIVFFVNPVTSGLVGIAAGISGEGKSSTGNFTVFSSVAVSSSQVSSSQGQASTSTSLVGTTQSQPPPPTTPSTQTVTTVLTVLQPLASPGPDYTPIGLAIVAAAGIMGLVVMFLKRK